MENIKLAPKSNKNIVKRKKYICFFHILEQPWCLICISSPKKVNGVVHKKQHLAKNSTKFYWWFAEYMYYVDLQMYWVESVSNCRISYNVKCTMIVYHHIVFVCFFFIAAAEQFFSYLAAVTIYRLTGLQI
jgi:hypothetical protein